MDPVEQLYRRIQAGKWKVTECDNEIKKTNVPDVINAYTLIKSLHVSTVTALSAEVTQILQAQLSALNPPTN